LIHEHPGVLAQRTFNQKNAPRWKRGAFFDWRFLGTLKRRFCNYDKGNTG
jgi:hypothetical protein